jgi:hypothetical protein
VLSITIQSFKNFNTLTTPLSSVFEATDYIPRQSPIRFKAFVRVYPLGSKLVAPGKFMPQKIIGSMHVSNWFLQILWLYVQTFVAHNIGGNVIKIFSNFFVFIDGTDFQSNLVDWLPTPLPVHCSI